MTKAPIDIPTRVRFATPYLEVERQSTSPWERAIKRELAQATHTANANERKLRDGHISANETGRLTMMTTVRCQHCEGTIRVSEPMIVLAGGQAPRTSGAGGPDTGGPMGECYHPACYSVVSRSAGWTVSRRQRFAKNAC